MSMKSGIPSGIHSGIHKRLYSVLPRPAAASSQHRPRPRSNSASLYTTSSLLPLSFFDSPPAPPSRPPLTPPRVPTEGPKQHNPNPLALTPSLDDTPLHPQLLSTSLPYQYPSHPLYDHDSCTPLNPHHKRPRPHYQLDVGAYGIPKRCRHPRRAFHTTPPDSLHLAVQIGEDAYFVRDNAMGVADGVGGWARTHPPPLPADPTPSALFARRLMHYTSAQLDLPEDCPPVDPGPVQDLDAHLNDLSEGIDILQIMERAYDQTVNAHVQPTTAKPLHTGSSTALVAVLDNNASAATEQEEPVLKIAHIGDCMGMLIRDEEVVWRSEEMWWAFNTPVQLAPPPRPPTPPLPTLGPFLSRSASPTYRPFHPPPLPKPIPSPKMANLVTPKTTAHLVTLPVKPDDILILASDGLSDNLWDEDVLDEVVRFRRTWTGTSEPGVGVQVSTSTVNFNDAGEVVDGEKLRRHTMAGMLSEALCSRARRVSENRPGVGRPLNTAVSPPPMIKEEEKDLETPFGRRAREEGKAFVGGKRDDISVLVAIVSPAPNSHKHPHTTSGS